LLQSAPQRPKNREAPFLFTILSIGYIAFLDIESAIFLSTETPIVGLQTKMEILKGTALSKYLLEKYAKNPKGWNFTIAPASKDSFFDALVSGPEENWQLKIDSIFKPAPVVLGAQVDAATKKVPAGLLPSYGYRKLDPEIILKVLTEQERVDSTNDTSALFGRLIDSLEPTAPVPGSSYAQGPFVFTNQKLLGISDSQKKLDDRLSSELRNLLREKFISYG
jgi:hypothetical protein